MIYFSIRTKIASFLLMCLLIAPAFGAVAAADDGPRINGKIGFISDRDGNLEVYAMNADGSGQTDLTNNSADDGYPSWSPNGTKIAFDTDRDGNNEIYVMNADGTGQTRLTNNNYDDWQPNWSPDGSKIAFCSDRDGNNEIYVMNADGTGQTRLTNNNYVDERPLFSPDGTKILWDSDRGIHWDIYVMNANGSGETRLTNNYGIYDGEASWSPDGTKIAFCSGRDGNYEIYVMNANGSGETRLTNNNYDEGDTCWSPDGTKIAFSSTRDGNYELYIMNADGTGQTRLTNTSADEWGPSWQTLYMTNFQQIGIGSDFTGNMLDVDGSSYTVGQLPESSPWGNGTSHNFSWFSPLTVSSEKRYVWAYTSGLSTEMSGTFVATSGNDSIIANYATQYYVMFQTQSGGSIAQSSGWYNASSAVSVSATPSTGYRFSFWTVAGSVSVTDAASQNTTLTVNGPGNATASFVLSDTAPPTITSISPANGSISTTGSVTISASFSDNEGIDASSVVLKMDGTAVTAGVAANSTGVSYSATLPQGTHTVELTVRDMAGNPKTASWTFSVQQPAGGIPMEYIIAIIAVVAAIVVLIIFLARRKKPAAAAKPSKPS